MSDGASPAQRTGEIAPRHPSLLAFLPRVLAVALAAGVAAVVMVNWNRWTGATAPQWMDDAALAADLSPLSAQVAGRISAVPITDFQ